jgi:hypothetical protein
MSHSLFIVYGEDYTIASKHDVTENPGEKTITIPIVVNRTRAQMVAITAITRVSGDHTHLPDLSFPIQIRIRHTTIVRLDEGSFWARFDLSHFYGDAKNGDIIHVTCQSLS